MTKKFILMLLIVIMPALASAAKRTYPGKSPCNTTLQKCINGANSGDVIQIKQSTIDESLTIKKSLTLAPAPGYPAPIIGGGATTQSILLYDNAGKPIHVTLRQLHLVNTSIWVDYPEGPGSSFTLIDSEIEFDTPSGKAININGGESSDYYIERNTIKSSNYGIYLYSNPASNAELNVTVASNTFTTLNPANSAGGMVINTQDGKLTALVSNNLIYDVGGCNCGNQAAMSLTAGGTSDATMLVSGNTIDDVNQGDGIHVNSGNTNLIAAYIQNNIATNVAGNGISLPAAFFGSQIIEDYNTYFNTGMSFGGYSQGADTYYQDPTYVDAAARDYRPSFFSPVLNAGNMFFVAHVDSTGKPRKLGPAPDRGALERGNDFLINYLLWFDDFEDATLNQNYTYLSGLWTEEGKNFVGNSKGKGAVLLNPTFCSQCSVQAEMSTAGHRIKGKKNLVSLLAWYQDSTTYYELRMDEESDKWTLVQYVNGALVQKKSVNQKIVPFAEYEVTLKYDGSNIHVLIDSVAVMTMSPSGLPNGTFGTKVTSAYGMFGNISIYY